VVVVVVTVTVVVTAVVVSAVTSAGTFVQVDALQIMPDGHMFPQIPQLRALAVRS
jgi:hypothetical protein